MRSAWEKSGLHAAEGFITDRLFEGLPFVAATSVQEVRGKMKPYIEAGCNPSYLARCSFFHPML